jgi:hypothetical protein
MMLRVAALLRAARSRAEAVSVSFVIGAVWFAVVYFTIVWVWGLDPHATASPDEAVNRLAAALVRSQGSPFIHLPFVDAEDLAHPRSWISLGNRALPSYAPVAIYWYAFCLCFGKLGLALVAALPASATAAFSVGTARLLPNDRQWLALPAPLLGSPALFWLLRPWINVSVLLSCVAWAFFFWASWRQSGRPRWLTYAALAIGAAAAVRPDYAAYLFPGALLLGLTAGAEQRTRVLLSILAAGSVAVLLNMILNWMGTGHPLVGAYQLELARDEGADTASAAPSSGPLELLSQLLIPMGVPPVARALRFLARYWLHTGMLAGLAFAQLSVIPLLWRKPPRARLAYALALLLMFGFMLSRMAPVLYGTAEPSGMIDHSIPRYWTPVYLLAAVPPIVFLGSLRQNVAVAAGALFLAALAIGNGYDVWTGTKWSLVSLRAYRMRSTALALSLEELPSTAWVYTETLDKALWSYWHVGTLSEPRATAKSMARAFGAGLDVYAFEPKLRPREYEALERALRRQGLAFTKRRPHGLFRVVRKPEE